MLGIENPSLGVPTIHWEETDSSIRKQWCDVKASVGALVHRQVKGLMVQMEGMCDKVSGHGWPAEKPVVLRVNLG